MDHSKNYFKKHYFIFKLNNFISFLITNFFSINFLNNYLSSFLITIFIL
jgi:hypothetical protein